ncbi:DUF3800 domain-containing protein [Bergeyella cardium]|uniref:DUF3800 domain-containing protein n=1 Tax=Bergeyella cardium TaxID=1585976 RepID=A0A6P1QXN4_9FLAO|nr:DUF3800 domain-containing protein [Bergeyella cardium]QHN65484.1 DUF3800 domain-containing protein [Bergeyella cardium]WHE33064.1 DUF3800 domain-containing protein [Bergeyella cardium]WHF59714.1 DUF3800 domain-containing protein [Bergeyella cardium]
MTIGYADEFGNNSFDFDKQGTHFIVASILIDEKNISTIEQKLKNIRQKYFQTGEIKSSKVANNHKRRIKILTDLQQLDFTIFAVIVDKKSLYSKGFHYKKSFYKYINHLLYKELFNTFDSLSLYVDEFGSNKFMQEFKKYVNKKHPLTLFSNIEFAHQNSKNSIFIQLSDFIAGSLGYIYDETKKNNKSIDIKKLLYNKIAYIRQFPNPLPIIKSISQDDNFDEDISKLSLLRIESFIEKNESNQDPQIKEQIHFLNILLFLQQVKPWVSTKEILNHLNIKRKEPMNKEYFRSKIIGNLRDKGIIIASSQKGYKIPISLKDIGHFIKHGNRVILPMLNRIKEVNNAIKLISKNKINILYNYNELNKIINSIEEIS